MKDKVIIDVLIENIRTDLEMLDSVERQLEPLQQQQREITERLRDHRKDVSVLIKYADEESQKQLEELGFAMPHNVGGLNPVAAMALEAVARSKDRKLTNDALYSAYAKACREKEEEPLGYADFNIKCRPLFNSQKLVRTKGKDPKSSRDDMISLNGSAVAPPKKEAK